MEVDLVAIHCRADVPTIGLSEKGRETLTVETLDVIRAAARMAYGENDVVNVFHFLLSSGSSMSDELAIADVLEGLEDIYTIARAVISEYQTFEDIKLDVVEIVSGLPRVVRNLGIFSWPTLEAGAGAGEPLPSGVAALLSLRTAGVRTLGRKFFGRIPEGMWNGDSWTSTCLTTLGNVGSLMIADMVETTGTWKPIVFSKALASWTPFIGATAKSIAAYCRRRKPGVGS